jgi:hypothetical protein
MNEIWFDVEEGTYNSNKFIIEEDGTIIKPKSEKDDYHAFEKIRCYAIPEIKRMLSQAGLEYIASYSDKYLDLPLVQLVADLPRGIVTARCPE